MKTKPCSRRQNLSCNYYIVQALKPAITRC